MWELAGNYTGTMIGYHAASLIADSYVKGYRNFDVRKPIKLVFVNMIRHHYPILVPHLMPQAKYWKNGQLRTCDEQ